MAPPSGQLRPGRYFAALAGIVVLLYGLALGTGNHRLTPRLGLDLRGGTTVTLTAITKNGQPPKPEQLQEAQRIIEQRVNGLGVAEAEVVTEGADHIVISIPGKKGDAAKQIAQTAQLRFRQVLQATQGGAPAPSTTPSPSGSATPSPSTSPKASAKATPKAQKSSQKRALSGALRAGGSPSPSPSASSAAPAPSGIAGATGAALNKYSAEQLFASRQVSCADLATRPPGSTDNPDKTQVACDDHGVKYLLDKAKVVGTDVSSAGIATTDLGGWKVTLSFTGSGQSKWTNLTKQAFGASPPKNQVAIVLDGRVVSAPAIQGVIAGDAEITGNFSQSEAEALANVLKYGALPLSFQTSQALTVSPTLGTDQLKAGLLAGGIGLLLVVIYSLIYYRALGLVTIASLVLSGAIIYASVVLLGRYIGFTLTLAGIAGFIVAVGITADSFVVFFERLKDEVQLGRTVRSSVPRAWVRARRTILSADTISFLAAAVLYILSVGAVKGFAFTLGLSTIIDVLIVFLFTHPLVAVASRAKTFASPRISGLGNVRHREPAGAELAGSGRRTPTPKES